LAHFWKYAYNFKHLTQERMTSMFDSDLRFCPECGTIFPLPVEGDNVTCLNRSCSFQVPVSVFYNVVTTTEIIFNQNAGRKLTNLPDEFGLGPMVDKICPQCGNDRMIYTTLQTRSADEGQTIFYLCPKCRFRDREDSWISCIDCSSSFKCSCACLVQLIIFGQQMPGVQILLCLSINQSSVHDHWSPLGLMGTNLFWIHLTI